MYWCYSHLPLFMRRAFCNDSEQEAQAEPDTINSIKVLNLSSVVRLL